MLVCAKCAILGTRDRGCSVHPAFPAPSVLERANEIEELGQIIAARILFAWLFEIRIPDPSSPRERNCAHRWRCEPCGALAPRGEPRRMNRPQAGRRPSRPA